MPYFSEKSLSILETCDVRLVRLFMEVVNGFDCAVASDGGWRDEETQNELYRNGFSKKRWPDSKHNHYLSLAVDCPPYPIDWEDVERMAYFAGYVRAKAERMDIPIIWGGDWDNDTEIKDTTFRDFAHFELIDDTETEEQD